MKVGLSIAARKIDVRPGFPESCGMFHIAINNKQSILLLDENWIRQIVEHTLQQEEVAAATISIAIVDDNEIHEINRRHLQHDYPTDVISFLIEESGGDESRRSDPTGRCSGKTIEGEIVVSTETAVDVALDYGTEPHDEVALYLIHGLLHVCGYDDLTDEELPLMRARERVALTALRIEIPQRDDE